MNHRQVLQIVIIFASIQTAEPILGWLFGSGEDAASQQMDTSAQDDASQIHGLKLRNVPFEVESVEEKFAASGRELIAKMSQLDQCHLLVVSELKTACTDITEEDLAKLGVALLNCQSQAEGRPVYPCTPDMTVAECTKPMDPDTWNAYLIVSNRARSVCYSVRQQQFQRQTQFAVSQLASSAEDQLYLMEHLRQNQLQLASVAEETLQSVSDGQQELLTAQETMKTTQLQLQEGLAGNVEGLMKEKALIAAGHKELAEMANNISKKLDNATQQLFEQDLDRQQYRREVMEDLAGIQNKTKALIDQLETNFHEVLSFQQGSSDYYQETLQKLLMVNQTVSYLLGTVGEMKEGIDEKLTWVTALLGGAEKLLIAHTNYNGDNIELLVTCVFHLCYFFVMAFILTFLGTPVTSRLMVILLVPLNALAEINHGCSLDFASLTLVIGVIISVNLGVKCLTRNYRTGILPPPTPREGSCLTCQTNPLKLSPIQPINSNDTIASIQLNLTSKTVGDLSVDEHEDSGDWQEDKSMMTKDETTLNAELASLLRDKDSSRIHDHTVVQNLSRMSAAPTPEKSSTDSVDQAKRPLGPVLNSIPTTTDKTMSPVLGRNSSKLAPGSPQRALCSGRTKTGQNCRLLSAKGSPYCYRHSGDTKE
ncbi:Protein brambleberry [Holothuria leucospilota]|uniref:Protein brambleberry n=1 Tax=Holothuria leucospilota TaxID=206669 RepID=A0A9Q1H8J0_HOLLE|nr:Protein brambleberry [Holothuria leucospilota]